MACNGDPTAALATNAGPSHLENDGMRLEKARDTYEPARLIACAPEASGSCMEHRKRLNSLLYKRPIQLRNETKEDHVDTVSHNSKFEARSSANKEGNVGP